MDENIVKRRPWKLLVLLFSVPLFVPAVFVLARVSLLVTAALLVVLYLFGPQIVDWMLDARRLAKKENRR